MDAEFERLWRLSAAKIRRFALSVTHDRDVADDVMQDARIRAWRCFEQFRRGAAFETWVMRIVVNVHLDMLRKLAARPATIPLTVIAEGDGAEIEIRMPLVDHEGQQIRRLGNEQILSAALLGISARRRQVIGCVADGLTMREIARECAIPEGTVRSRVHHARAAVRELVAVSELG